MARRRRWRGGGDSAAAAVTAEARRQQPAWQLGGSTAAAWGHQRQHRGRKRGDGGSGSSPTARRQRGGGGGGQRIGSGHGRGSRRTMRRISEAPWCEPIRNSNCRRFGRLLVFSPFPPFGVFTVHRTYIRTREFGGKRKSTRNVGTHIRCKAWTKYCPRSGPIKRYQSCIVPEET